MKKAVLVLMIFILWVSSFAQKGTSPNTLLWRISGKNLTKPSYLFGTIHMLCADDIQLSDSLRSAIAHCDKIYLEIDLDNMLEMLSALPKMKMRNDTTLEDLLPPKDYQTVKSFFEKQNSLLPFSVLQTYKPMLAAATLMESQADCDNEIAMEQLIMQEAKSDGKGIKGLETVAYQMSIFDSIPYQLQAKQLLSYVQDYGKGNDKKDVDELTNAYRNQELNKLEALTKKEDVGMGMENFSNLLIYNRNANWTKKLDDLLSKNSLVIALKMSPLIKSLLLGTPYLLPEF